MRRILTVALFASLSILAVACAAPADAPEEDVEETIGTAQQAKQKGDPLYGYICRACGCRMEGIVVDGCTETRCVCPSAREVWCVVRAPGGVGNESSMSDPKPPRFEVVVAPVTGASTKP